MATRSALINVMSRAAEKAARALRRDFGEIEQLQVSQKGPGDFVSNADLKAERMLKEELKKARPGFSFLMEESGRELGADADRLWIVDPLDGTTNFLHGLPHFAISIALAERGEVVAGVVYDPVKDELFWAEKGAGAFIADRRTDRRLRVSARKSLGDSLIGTGIPYGEHGEREPFLRQLEKIARETAGVRRWGAAALDLAYVAAGRFDGFWESGLSPWDVAAGALLVREAGGYVTDFAGAPAGLEDESILASNGALHAPLLALLRP